MSALGGGGGGGGEGDCEQSKVQVGLGLPDFRRRAFSDGMQQPQQQSSQQNEWGTLRVAQQKRAISERQFVIFASEPFIPMALKMQARAPERFRYLPIEWNKFPDGTDDITIQGFYPQNDVAGSHVLFLASFHNNDVTLSQFSVLIVLLQSFIESLTIVLPFYPVGTNERVEYEGKVATANTYSMLLSSLPTVGRPARIMIYDIHTLQNRFYFHSGMIPSLHSSTPLLFERLRSTSIRSVVFPDEGAAKRFGRIFKDEGFGVIICGKIRDGDRRIVCVQDGDPAGKDVVIVDDLVQTGGTLHECALALKALKATSVSAFVAHGVFPNQSWRRFLRGGDRDAFSHFWLTNSIPSVTSMLPQDDVFEVLDLMPVLLSDLDGFAHL